MKEEVLYEICAPKTLQEMSWYEVQEALKETDIVIVQTGSTEQHGPHNPLGTDNFTPYEVVKRAVKKLNSEGIKVVMGPLIPFGLALHHMAFPGTITLRPSTFHACIFDVCDSLIKHGFKNVVLYNGHGGNTHEVAMAALDLAEKTDANVYFVTARGPHPEELEVGEGRHSGQGETSIMLTLVPKLVNMELAKKNENAEFDKILLAPRPADYMSLTCKRWSELTNGLGYIGDPTIATPELGEKILDIRAEALADYIRTRIVNK